MVIVSKRVWAVLVVGMQCGLMVAQEVPALPLVPDTAALSTTGTATNQIAQPITSNSVPADPAAAVLPALENAPAASVVPPTSVVPDVPQPIAPAVAAPVASVDQKITSTPIEQPAVQAVPKPTVIPAPVEPQPEPAPENEEGIGIDTIDLDEPQGNWLFKRVWWERAESKYEKARKQTTAVLESRAKFFTERSTIDRTVLDPFYLEIGLTRGQIEEILQYLLERAKQEQQSDSLEASKERDFVARIQEEQKSLEQIVLDIKAIGKADVALDDALQTIIDQINKARGYEQDAWQNFKEIARVLDDNKARELYYKVDGAVRNIADIQEYITQPFSTYFDTLVSTIKDQTTRVTANVEALKQKGIDLKQQAQELFGSEEEVKPAAQEPQKIEEQEEEHEEQPGILATYVISPLATIWDSFIAIISWPYTVLFGNSDDEDESDEQSPAQSQSIVPKDAVPQAIQEPDQKDQPIDSSSTATHKTSAE